MSGINLKKYHSYIGCFIGGLFYALGFPVEFLPSVFFASFLGVTIFFTFLFQQSHFKGRFFHFLAFSFGAYILGYYWIPFTIQEFGNISFPFNQLLGLFFTLIVFPHFFVLLFFIPLIKKIHVFKPLSPITYPLIAFIITLIEHLTPTQFPTYLAHPFGHFAPFLGMAPIFGTSIYSFFCFWLILVLTLRPTAKKEIILSTTCFALFIAINFIKPLPTVIKAESPEQKMLSIRMVQANIGNFLKLSSEDGDINSLHQVIDRYKQMSLSYHPQIDLIIWPETAYPRTFYSRYLQSRNDYIPELFKEIILKQKADLFLGGYDFDQLNDNSVYETEYNAAFFFRYDQATSQPIFAGVYHKIILLAFGETLPFGPVNKFLSKYVSNISYFKKGDHFSLFETKNNTYFISSICYEILRPSFTRKYLNSVNHQPHFIINLTNDSWYGISSEPYQHLFLSKWRAYEFQIPIIRMTNTGISSIIYPDGSESARSNLHKVETLDLPLHYKDRSPTIYQRYGELTFIAFFFILIFLLYLFHFGLKIFKPQ